MTIEIVPGLGEKCEPVKQTAWKWGNPVHFHLDENAYVRVFMGPSCKA